MTVSFLNEKFEELLALKENENCIWITANGDLLRETMGILQKSVNSSIDIIHGLQKITRNFENHPKDQVQLKKFLEFSISSYRALHEETEFPEYQLECPENLEITTSPEIFLKVLINLYSYSINQSLKGRDHKWIRMSVKEEGASAFLEYHDSSEMDFSQIYKRIFEPYS